MRTSLLGKLTFLLAGVSFPFLLGPALGGDDPQSARDVDPDVKVSASLDRMAGQMIMVGFSGAGIDDRGTAAVMDQLREGTIGGIILFDRNIRSKRQLRILTSSLSRAAREGGQPQALIAVDQEGGYVQRLHRRNQHESFPYSAQSIARRCTPKQAGRVYRKLACQLRASDININLAPVADLDTRGASNPVIGKYRRSFGDNPEQVFAYAAWFNAAHKSFGLLTAIKHFPGHGSSLTDSHTQFTDISASWSEAELEPYSHLRKYDYADMVMVGHLYHPRFSDGRMPSSLSARAIRTELRRRLGFAGVVITDDLQMRAVQDAYPLEKRIPLAVNAGNDILLLSNSVKSRASLGKTVHKIITRLVRERCPADSSASCIERSTIEAAYSRIMHLKRKLRQLAVDQPDCTELAPIETLIDQACTKPVYVRREDS